MRGDRDNTKAPLPVTTEAAAVVVSTGANGFCGYWRDLETGNRVQLAPPDDARWNCGGPTGASEVDEHENVDLDGVFVARRRSEGGAGCDDAAGSGGPLCAFDDLVVWIPASLLLGKLVQAGRLP